MDVPKKTGLKAPFFWSDKIRLLDLSRSRIFFALVVDPCKLNAIANFGTTEHD
jgi:hypothetical protein